MSTRLFVSFLVVLTTFCAKPAFAQDGSSEVVSIEATIRTFVLSEPRINSEFIRSVERGAEGTAYGRDSEGTWLRLFDGWVLAEVFNSFGEIGALPDTTHSILGSTTKHTHL